MRHASCVCGCLPFMEAPPAFFGNHHLPCLEQPSAFGNATYLFLKNHRSPSEALHARSGCATAPYGPQRRTRECGVALHPSQPRGRAYGVCSIVSSARVWASTSHTPPPLLNWRRRRRGVRATLGSQDKEREDLACFDGGHHSFRPAGRLLGIHPNT